MRGLIWPSVESDEISHSGKLPCVAVLDPVTPFLALIDRIISLVRERETKRREYFEKIVEPLYIQFKPLGEDYLNLFRDPQEAIKNSKKQRRVRVVSAVKKKRDEFAAARAQLRALLEACERNATKKKDKELTEFIAAMAGFFQPMVLSTRFPSIGRELVNFFELWAGPDSNTIIEKYLPAAAARLEASWYEISGRYMELKLKALGL
jgi:hypothetical protein